ncbi:ABC transporter permease [Halocynthiibacter namhaensis]|uniref:ABC transporter permease n=1 Tax=Halocynthiibacter namhaensis TaxID=1290553 RepID=UPI000578EF18|nr:ABC transporter permease [Halocynthiibacter namhaensis]
MEFFDTIIQISDSAVRLAIPLLLACLAGLFSERGGIFDIGLEGKMLAAAFLSAAVAAATGNVWLGLASGIGISVFLGLIHGVASITFRGDQLISGVAINFLAAGLTVVIGQAWFGLGGRTPPLSGSGRFANLEWPVADALQDVPVVGPIYAELISGHTVLVYVALLIVPLSWYVLFRTRFGLRLRAVGENPGAVDTAGISVVRLRYSAVIICGVLCGLAGAYLSTGLAAGFVKDMSAGRGFIALAALIFAKWRPVQALIACLLFGFLEAIANRYQSIDTGAFEIPVQFMQALPYILTVVILAGFIGKAIPPKAGGEAYVKER